MLDNNPLVYPYPSRRTVTYGKNGMVATSQPLAAQAGLAILKQGGNAVDAAVATAAALTVVEPTGCGLGGDAFAIVWDGGRMHGLNASGPSPRALTLDAIRKLGHDAMPRYGMAPVTVPGLPAGWAALSEKFGALPFEELMQPAIDLAHDGFPVSPTISQLWKKAEIIYRNELNDQADSWLKVFAPGGHSPEAGDIFVSEAHARTLERIGATRARDFYSGETAHAIDRFSRQRGGFLRAEDLAGYTPEWVCPVSVNYRGFDIWEMPPNGQGLVVLMALNILSKFEIAGQDPVETLHRQIEAIKLATTDGRAYITQQDAMTVSMDALLSSAYADERRQLIGERALSPEPGKPEQGGTVYLACADAQGMMISYIQSNFEGFGSGMVVPGTGIALQNRGTHFSLDPRHGNCLQPGKKTFHTIIPGFISKDGLPLGPFGVMGGFMQPQAHVQVLMNMIDFKLNPQAALDSPRWQWMGGKTVGLEQNVPNTIAQALASRGHNIELSHDSSGYGRGQIILRNPATGVLCGGTEHRTDGYIAVW